MDKKATNNQSLLKENKDASNISFSNFEETQSALLNDNSSIKSAYKVIHEFKTLNEGLSTKTQKETENVLNITNKFIVLFL